MTAIANPAAASDIGPISTADRWTDVIGGLVERHPSVFRWIGDLETSIAGDAVGDIAIDRPIYICGLARSGSTILLELLARHSAAASHRYRDFPMLHAPLAWNWFVDRAGKDDDEPRERAHQDRIQVTRESPEAFEEVLWMTFFPRLHDGAECMVLDGRQPNPAFDAFYEDHIRKLLKLRRGTRYLAKANYDLTRIGYIRRLFPDARFIVPVRDPVWHVASLIKQHRLLCEIGASDARARRQLRRAGHFEFGLDRRTMNLGDGQANVIESCWAHGREVEGWARSWASAYGLLPKILDDPDLREATLVVRYESLCRNPAATLAGVLAHCGLTSEGIPDHAARVVSAPAYYDLPFDGADICDIRAYTRPIAEHIGY